MKMAELTREERDELTARRERLRAWVQAILRNRDAPGNAVRVAVALAEHFNFERGDAWPKQVTLAEEAGLSQPAASKALAWLKEAGALTVQRGRYGNEYRFLLDGADIWKSDIRKPNIQEPENSGRVIRFPNMENSVSGGSDIRKPNTPYKDEPKKEPGKEPLRARAREEDRSLDLREFHCRAQQALQRAGLGHLQGRPRLIEEFEFQAGGAVLRIWGRTALFAQHVRDELHLHTALAAAFGVTRCEARPL